MKAVVYHGPGVIAVEDRPAPVPADDNLVVKVHCCAICGTDLKLATTGNPRCQPPRVIGHEMVGTIVHAGRAVRGFSPGERVTLATTVACGQCACCGLGLGNLCPRSTPISYVHDGAFAEFLAVPPAALAGGNVLKVPAHVPDEAAALSEPLSCAQNGLAIAGFRPGDTVLILGGGPLGALHALLVQALGAAAVMVVQRSEPRVSMLRSLKGVRVIDGAREDALAVVREQTGGLGADVVVVCAPERSAQEESLRYARKGGAVSLFASLPQGAAEITLDSRTIHYGELRVTGASDSRPEHVAAVVTLMAEGRLDPRPAITHRIPLQDIHRGIELMKKKECLKVLVFPGDGSAKV